MVKTFFNDYGRISIIGNVGQGMADEMSSDKYEMLHIGRLNWGILSESQGPGERCRADRPRGTIVSSLKVVVK